MCLKKKKQKASLCFAIFIVSLIMWVLWGNTALELNSYTVTSDRIPEEFNGFRIAQVSDLHNAEIGQDNKKLLSVINECEPDIIAITGDLIDSRDTDIETALSFVGEAVKIAPCYYVTGNHEARVAEYDELKNGLIQLGVTVLDNKRIDIEKDGKSITLIGVDDPSFYTDYLFDIEELALKKQLEGLKNDTALYTVMLSHRPEFFDVYAHFGVNLTLCGHAHGGQIRMPFVGGIFAPHQGFFPEYDGGLYREGASDMIVSRGVGNSLFPLRVNNRPEIVLIELQSQI